MPSILRTRTAAIVFSAAGWLAVIGWAFAGTAGAGLGDGLLPTTTTSTAIADPLAPVEDLVDLPTETTTTTTPPTTAAPPATTTTEPPDPGSNTDHGTGNVGTETSRGGDAGLAPVAGPKPVIPAPPIAPATRPVNAQVPDVGSAAGKVAPGPVVTSTKTVTAAPAPITSSIAVPFVGRSTLPILTKLEAAGMTPSAIARLLAPFPVAGRATYSSDFGAPRHSPQLHPHEGTDIFADRGTPVIASSDGTVTHVTRDTEIAGTSLRVNAEGGTYFYYAHLDRLAAGLRENDRVAKGEVIGFVGTSGNAQGTAPHLHYEIHPDGGAAVDPVPYLDRWLADASVSAESVQGVPTLSLRATSPKATTARNRAAVAPATTDIGNAQPISSAGVAPAVVMLLLTAMVVSVRWFRGRSQARTR